jgi:hypothetical protein
MKQQSTSTWNSRKHSKLLEMIEFDNEGVESHLKSLIETIDNETISSLKFSIVDVMKTSVKNGNIQMKMCETIKRLLNSGVNREEIGSIVFQVLDFLAILKDFESLRYLVNVVDLAHQVLSKSKENKIALFKRVNTL